MKRRLAAVLAADVVGYSRLMQDDEAGTVAALTQRRKEILSPLLVKHHGRIVKLMGDGVLVEFASAVHAVQCGAELQQAMEAANDGAPEARRIVLRIGITLGDCIVQGDDLFGDGVIIATRLESMAEPGSIYVSGTLINHVRNKVEFDFEDLGEHPVKNMDEAVRVYRLIPMSGPASAGAATPARLLPRPSQPSIAVLPFTNMSGDPEQEFFADGLAEDLLTELSRFRDLFVISRNSSFKYKGTSPNLQKAAQELGVQYLVEGSVRKAGDRVRVTVQLIDAELDRHVWAERYDRKLEDIFALQDEVTSAIVSVLPRRVEAATHDRAARKLPANMAAYECVLAGKLLHHRSTSADNAEALRLLDRAIALDPKYAHAHAWKACVTGQSWVYGWCTDREQAWQTVTGELQTALALDENDSDVHRILAAVHLSSGEHDKAIYHQERALTLNPNDDLIVVQKGEILTWIGQPEEGVSWIQKAMRLNPYHPERFWNHLGRAYFVARRYREAIDAFNRITALDPSHHAFLAACHAGLGETAAADLHAREVLRRQADFTIDGYMATLHYKDEADAAHHRAALEKAGLPA